MMRNIYKKSYLKPIIFKNLKVEHCLYGRGVYAEEYIGIGEKILEFGGAIISSKELPYPYESEKDYFLQIGHDLYLGPSGDIDDYVNHSCSPNSGVRIKNGCVELIAILPIQCGDQVTFNYTTTMSSDWGEFRCGCGSKKCCGIVKKFKDLPPSVQKKYIRQDVVPNYILAKIINI
jgi:hypothetical protein